MTYSNAHTQSYIAQEKQLVINQLREKVTVAYKRIRELEQEIQDKVSEINTLKEELQLNTLPNAKYSNRYGWTLDK